MARVAEEVRAVIERCKIEGANIYLPGSDGTGPRLDPKLYKAVDKVLQSLGGKWDRKAGAHVFTKDAAGVLDGIILTGEVTLPADFGFFETPEALAKNAVAMLGDIKGKVVLEPSAGGGRLARAIVAAGGKAYCVEIQKGLADKLAATGEFEDVVNTDFLTTTPGVRWFDFIVMNPPFAAQADIKHVSHAIRFLAPGGVLVAIMSSSVQFRQDRKTLAFHEMLGSEGGAEIDSLPAGSFKESGTMVSTCVLRFRKAVA